MVHILSPLLGEGVKKSPPLGEGARRAGEVFKKSPPLGEGVTK